MDNRRSLLPIGACFLLSGATSLTFEVAWSKQLSYLLGNSLYAVATVVAAFMAGLCLGSLRASRLGGRVKRELRAYAILQTVIGLFGLLSIPLLRLAEPLFAALYRALGHAQPGFLLLRFALVFGFMLIPAFLMGMTLPILTGGLARREGRVDRSSGLLYGINTLGGVLGTAIAGFVLVPSLGLFGTCALAASADLATAGAALHLQRRLQEPAPAGPGADPGPEPHPSGAIESRREGGVKRGRSLSLLFALSGLVALVYEIVWFRLLVLILGPSVYALAAMLAVYLAGIGMGSAVAAPLLGRTRLPAFTWIAVFEGFLGLTSLLGLFLANHLPSLYLTVAGHTLASLGGSGLALAQFAAAGLLVFVPCLFLGALFPAVVRALEESLGATPAEFLVGRLYWVNTAGAIAGSLAAGFLLVPRLGVWTTLRLAGLASAGLAVWAAWMASRRPARRLLAPVPLLACLGLAAAAPPWDAALYNRGLYQNLYLDSSQGDRADRSARGESGGALPLLFHREGLNAPVAVFGGAGGATLHVCGKPDAGTNLDVQTQVLLGHLPVLFTRNPERVLVIGYGSGMTAGAVLSHPEVQSLDLVELEAAVVAASPYFDWINGRPLEDPRTHLIIEDGRVHLAASDAYDLISSEPSNPWMAGISNLFTVDFYREASRRLRPGGIFAQWIQNYAISEEALAVILASMHEAFPHLVLFQVSQGDFMVLASVEPLVRPWEEVHAAFGRPGPAASLARLGIRDPLELGFFLLLPESEVLRLAAQAPRCNTDNNAWLEYHMPRELVRVALDPEAGGGVEGALARRGAPGKLAALEAMWPGFPRADGLKAMVEFPHEREPLTIDGRWLFDTWQEMREAQMAGLLSALKSEERADPTGSAAGLASRIAAWDQAADARRRAREEASLALVQARADGSLQPDQAGRILEELGDLPLADAFLGAMEQGRGNAEAASQAYRRVLLHPESESYLDALLGLGRLARDRGDNAAARDLFRRASDWNPYYPQPWVLLARICQRMKDADGARQAVERGLFFNPEDASLRELARSRG